MEKSSKIEKNLVSEENILNWNSVQDSFQKAFGRRFIQVGSKIYLY